jgi:hypothetical protein
MPSVNKTTNLGLNQWSGNEYPKRLDFVEDNATIDGAVGKLANLVTTDKTNLVAAVNEVKEQNDNLEAEVLQPDYTPVLKRQEPVFSVGTGYDSNNVLQDLKSSIIKGQVPINARGLSVVNLFGSDGDCEDISKFNATQATLSLDSVNKVRGSNSIKFTATLTSGWSSMAKWNFKLDSTKYYLYTGNLKNGTFASGVRLGCGGLTNTNSSIVTATTFTRVGLKIPGSQVRADGTVHLTATNVMATDTVAGNCANADCLMIHEITADEYNNLTVEQLMVKYPYINGLQGVNNVAVKSVGKNLVYNGNTEYGVDGWNIGVGCSLIIENRMFKVSTAGTSKAIYRNINVKPNTNYYLSAISAVGTGTAYLQILDLNGANIKAGNGAFNSGNNNVIQLSVTMTAVGYIYYGMIQIEEGTVATAYEPYVESVSEIPVVLHSLPNSVKDEIVDGKLIKRIAEKTLIASDIASLGTAPINVDVVTLNLLDNQVAVNGGAAALGNAIVNGYTETPRTGYDSSTNIGKFFISDSAYGTGKICLCVAKGTYANSAAAQAALAGTRLIYQRTTPIVEDLVTPLTVFPNGTISVESDMETTMPELNFAYPLDMASVIARLNEAVNQNAKLIQDKADKEQEDWITATLQNGWTGTLQYRKNQIGQLELKASITAGTVTIGTAITSMPTGYRPTNVNAPIVAYDTSGTCLLGLTLLASSDLRLYAPSTGWTTGKVYMFDVVIALG